MQEATRAASVFNLYLSKGRTNGHAKQWIAETDDMKKVLKAALEPFIIAYWGVAKTLAQVCLIIIMLDFLISHILKH